MPDSESSSSHTKWTIKTAVKIAAAYCVTGIVWIVLSDKLLALVTPDPVFLTSLQTYKGWIYVLVTAVLLFALVLHYLKAIGHSHQTLAGNRTELSRLNRIYEVLSGVNGTLLRASDEHRLLFDICDTAVGKGEFLIAWIALRDDSSCEMKPVAWSFHPTLNAGITTTLLADLHAVENSPFTASLSNGERILCDFPSGTEPPCEAWAPLLEHGIRSVASFPIQENGRRLGVFVFCAREPDFFDAQEIKLLDDLAADTGLGLEHIRNRKRIYHAVNYDPLTGLPTEGLLKDRLEQVISRSSYDKRTVVIIRVEIFELRRITDSLGRHASDQVITAVAAQLRSLLRDGDTVARTGGDEFGILLVDMADKDDVTPVVNRLIRMFPLKLTHDEHELFISIKAGAAAYPSDGDSAVDILLNAERALHTSHTGTLNACEFYSDSMAAQAIEFHTLEMELHRALAADEIVLHYQPVVDLATRHIVGLEALARWSSPKLGLVPPDRFIPVAEETGLSVPLGRQLMKRAFRQIAAWQAGGCLPGRISVNISVKHLLAPNAVEDIFRLLEETEFDPGAGRLALEITEGDLIGDFDQAAPLLEQLRARGVMIYLDDFGTGYSSLAYLSRLPVDVLKIDRSFVMALADDARARTLVKGIMGMAHSLSLDVIAEGVETETQLAFLLEYGCTKGQGFLFSRAEPPHVISRQLCGRRHQATETYAHIPA